MPRLLEGETQLSTTIAKDIKDRLEHLSIDDLKTYRAKLEYLIQKEYERRKQSRELVDHRLEYYVGDIPATELNTRTGGEHDHVRKQPEAVKP